MAITKSAKKAQRQNQKRRQKNVEQNKKLKKLLKKALSLIKEGKKEDAKKMLPEIYQALDKAAKNNLIKKNKSSRKKSRINKMLSK
ncbi:30S ribosomal protein S20 [Candidatus Gribaldobacteria bacterium]|nr:30S ribosomal protein S20 [Candidatus Gribaldobacteria bacterium]